MSVPDLSVAAQYTAHGVVDAVIAFVTYMGWDIDRWQNLVRSAHDDLGEVVDRSKVLIPEVSPPSPGG